MDLPRRHYESSARREGRFRELQNPAKLSHTCGRTLLTSPYTSMARVKLNPIVDQVQGAFGDIVFRQIGGETVISRRAYPGGPPTPG